MSAVLLFDWAFGTELRHAVQVTVAPSTAREPVHEASA